ncbi:protein kinase domain-containing protein [Streptomyces kanamyceticus]|uniref:Serine/threonine protein kinase n=1 Tax=Streptomyces kanamyceticus TaxID=1967 RepID=A0A5J6GDY9_STRKN|nr:PQQ-binding-like beta-propeller repeat protein [Streptomyces kanamyceticus]QEU92692.1 serine/threonine protein kinase [Streptomyces kanamyceticus]
MSLRGGDPEEIGGYPLEARLGSGGMGTVFLGRTASGRPVAIKLIHQQFADDEEFRIRFRQEVAAARRVSGAFTAAVIDADHEAEHPWMATAFIEGHTLAQRIAKHGPIGGAELRTLAIGLTEALRDIHRAGVVHRDLKPSNVVLSPEGPRVIDFGISRATDQQTLTMTGRVIGTPPFMSPEQLQAPRGVGPRSDVFSLGTLLVYAATGQGPFDADSPYMTAYQVVHEAPSLGAVPTVLRSVVEPCLSKDPENRPSADELLVRLRDLPSDLGGPAGAGGGCPTRETDTQHHLSADDTPSPGAPPGPAETDGHPHTGTLIGRHLRRRWRPVLAAAVAVAAIAGGATLMRTGSSDEPGGTGGEGGNVAATGSAALPHRFEPWKKTVLGGRPDIPDELRCLTRGDAVYCGGGGVVAARLRASDGSRVWTEKSPGVPVQGMHLVGATDDTVLGYRFAAEDAPGDPATEVVAIDADKGKELWSVPSGAQSTAVTGRTQDAVVVGSTVVTVDASNTRLEARSAHSGAVAWRQPFPAGTQCSPVPSGARLYAMCAPTTEVSATDVRHPTLHVVDLDSGTLGRSIALKGPAQPVGTDEDGLVLLHRDEKRLVSVGYDGVLRVGRDSHKVTYSRLPKTYAGTPGMADGSVFVSGQTGLVTAFDPATGRKKWSRQTGVEGVSGPVGGDDGTLYFSSASGRVVALPARGGAPLWTTNPRAEGLAGETNASPRLVVAGRVVFVAAAENTVFSFDTTKPPKSG